MDQVTEVIQGNQGTLGLLMLGVLLIAAIYAIYTYLYTAALPTYTLLLAGEANARNPVKLTTDSVPRIATGTDFTLSLWFYIDDYNYRATQTKFLFALGPSLLGSAQGDSAQNVLVAALSPTTNDLMIRANAKPKTVTSPTPSELPATAGSSAPDITSESVLRSLMNQQTSMSMFQSTAGVDSLSPCDIREVPLQRWVNLTVSVSGRVMDVYLDGKLTRSCVLDSVVSVPTHGKLTLRLGDYGGFGGRVSYVQMWASQLTPATIYGIYQAGPAQSSPNIWKRLARLFDIELDVKYIDSELSHNIGNNSSSSHPTSLSSYSNSLYARL